jgi:plastocyanin
MLSFRLSVVLAVSIFMAACSGSNPSPSITTPSPTPSPASPAPMSTGATSNVSIQMGAAVLGARAFQPSPVTVAVGTTVTWTNADSIAHTTTSDSNAWNSGTLGPGAHFDFPFQSPGTFTYHCAIHPGMVGTIVVQ